MNIPENLKYTKEHEWIKIEGDTGIIGITEFAQKELGDIVFIEVETVGETLKIEESFGTIEAVKTVSDMFMPLSGEVTESINIDEFISVKSYKAKGKRISSFENKVIKFLDPLPYEKPKNEILMEDDSEEIKIPKEEDNETENDAEN